MDQTCYNRYIYIYTTVSSLEFGAEGVCIGSGNSFETNAKQEATRETSRFEASEPSPGSHKYDKTREKLRLEASEPLRDLLNRETTRDRSRCECGLEAGLRPAAAREKSRLEACEPPRDLLKHEKVKGKSRLEASEPQRV